MRTFGKKTVIVLGVFVASAIAQNNPVDEKWWPSEFGADDKVGAVNYITPEKRVAAAMLTGHAATWQ